MNALIVISALVAASSAAIINPYNAGLPIAGAYGAAPLAAPVAYGAAPAIPAALQAPASQFQAQDELGNLNYGYQNINSAKQEVGNTYGGVTGSYSYVDAYGIPQRVDYIADAAGFRVKATNLPVAPAVPNVALPVAPTFNLAAPVFDLKAPEPVEKTEEVIAAEAEFKKAFDEALAREKRDAGLPYAGCAGLGCGLGLNAYNLGYNGYNLGLNGINAYGLGLAAPAAYAGPVAAAQTISAPATREAVLTKIKLNPGHAIAYRVD